MNDEKKPKAMNQKTAVVLGALAALAPEALGPLKSGIRCKTCGADQPTPRPCAFCPGLPKDKPEVTE